MKDSGYTRDLAGAPLHNLEMYESVKVGYGVTFTSLLVYSLIDKD